MCNICKQSKWMSMRKEPTPVHVCFWCDKPIYVGDKYLNACDEIVCMDCVEENTHIAEEEAE